MPRLQLGSYGPGQCEACDKRFSKGLAIVDAAGQPVASLCQWCLLAMIDTLTGWEVTQWIVSLYQRKRFSKKWRDESRLLWLRMRQMRDDSTSSSSEE